MTRFSANVRFVPNSRNIEPLSSHANQVSVSKFGYGKFGSGDWAPKLADWGLTNAVLR